MKKISLIMVFVILILCTACNELSDASSYQSSSEILELTSSQAETLNSMSSENQTSIIPSSQDSTIAQNEPDGVDNSMPQSETSNIKNEITTESQSNKDNSNISVSDKWICPAPKSTSVTSFTEKYPSTFYGGIAAELKNSDAVAAQSGTVTAVQTAIGEEKGLYVTIDHGNGYVATYSHLSLITVEKGQKINQGDRIGKIGNTGKIGSIALEFTVTLNGKPVDGETLMK